MKQKKFWNWKNQAEEETTVRVLELYGTIAEEGWFDDDITPKMFKDELFSGTGPVTIWINSPGGDCIAASQIYSMLIDYPGEVTVKIDGIAASAASVIAMAGTTVLMAPTSLMMIHNPWTMACGDHGDMEKAIEMLNEVKESIINAYELKTGLRRNKISQLMEDETWMNAKKAIELGFSDGMLNAETEKKTDDDDEENDDDESDKKDEAFDFSEKATTKLLFNKLKKSIKVETPKEVNEKIEEVTPTGRSIDLLMERLNLMKY